MNNRRNFLKLAGTSAAATAALAAFPDSIRRALAIPANNATGSIRDVEHVVILMQENRSFDHYFGTLNGVRGFGDPFPIPLAGGLDVWRQTYTDSKGASRVVLPYHLDSSIGNAQRVSGTPHSYPDAQSAWNLGRMNQWPTYKQPQSMGYYGGAELDFQFALADAFTICDAYHCSFHGGTNTNRLFHWTGTNDPGGARGGPSIDNIGESLDGKANYTWTTYPERLQAKGISWKVYQNMPDNYTDNPLAGFQAYRDANRRRGNQANGAPFPPYTPNDETVSPLLKGVSNTMPDSGFLQALKDDIASGLLPQVSWIVAPATYSEHPGPSSPVQGAWYTQEVLNALTANPAVWSKTVLLVNFDENDGFFDHLPPPCAPAYDGDVLAGKSTVDTAGEYHVDRRPYGPGPRVPMFVVSPWSTGGFVNSQVFDHTSVLRMIERIAARWSAKPVRETNITAWRRAISGDLTTAFRPFQTGGGVDYLQRDAFFEQIFQAQFTRMPSGWRKLSAEDAAQFAKNPKDVAWMPRQEPGVRPSVALPYDLDARGALSADSSRFEIVLEARKGKFGEAAAGSPFHVYTPGLFRGGKDLRTRAYAVAAGDRVSDSWDLAGFEKGVYHLRVCGPNGFLREFAGTREEPRVELQCEASRNGDIELRVASQMNRPVTIQINDRAYGTAERRIALAPGARRTIAISLADSFRWYDFTVSILGADQYLRRFAGRVETGHEGFSDPAMGRA
jgi:phospholipase C